MPFGRIFFLAAKSRFSATNVSFLHFYWIRLMRIWTGSPLTPVLTSRLSDRDNHSAIFPPPCARSAASGLLERSCPVASMWILAPLRRTLEINRLNEGSRANEMFLCPHSLGPPCCLLLESKVTPSITCLPRGFQMTFIDVGSLQSIPSREQM